MVTFGLDPVQPSPRTGFFHTSCQSSNPVSPIQIRQSAKVGLTGWERGGLLARGNPPRTNPNPNPNFQSLLPLDSKSVKKCRRGEVSDRGFGLQDSDWPDRLRRPAATWHRNDAERRRDRCEMRGCRAGALSGGIACRCGGASACSSRGASPHAPSRCPPSAFSRCCEQQDRRSLSARHNSGGAVCLK